MRTIRLLFIGLLIGQVACGQPTVWRAQEDPADTHPIPDFTVPPARAEVDYERFIVIGDMGTGKPDQYSVAMAMAKRAESDGLDFVLTVGDNIYPIGVASATDLQWKTKFEDVYAANSLQVSWYPALGNHDYYGNEQAVIEYSQVNKKWILPSKYHTFTRTLSDGTKIQFFALDTDPILRMKPEASVELMWLDDQLSNSSAQWKIVYGHHPLYSNGAYPRVSPEKDIMIKALEPIFVKHKIDVYFAGHDHSLEILKPIKGIHYVISGAGAGPSRAYNVNWTDESFYAATLGGFVLCRVSRNELLIEFVRIGGGTQYAHVIKK